MKTDSWTDWEYFVMAVSIASGSDIWAQTGTNSKTVNKDSDKVESNEISR